MRRQARRTCTRTRAPSRILARHWGVQLCNCTGIDPMSCILRAGGVLVTNVCVSGVACESARECARTHSGRSARDAAALASSRLCCRTVNGYSCAPSAPSTVNQIIFALLARCHPRHELVAVHRAALLEQALRRPRLRLRLPPPLPHRARREEACDPARTCASSKVSSTSAPTDATS